MAKHMGPAMLRKAASVVSITAPATSTTIWINSTTGNRNAILRKLMILNRTPNAITLVIGETVLAAFVPRLPPIYCPVNVTILLTEAEIPSVVFESNIVAQASAAAAAPADVTVTAEVGEY